MKKILLLQITELVVLVAVAIRLLGEYAAGQPVSLWDEIWLFICIVILLAGFFLMWKEKRIKDFLVSQTEHLAKSREGRGEAGLEKHIELSALQSQINPHFLYNTLDSIRSEALVNHQTEIAKMTEYLSRFFRYCISGVEKIVKLSEEIRHIKDYFYIQKYRFGDKLNMEIHIEDESLTEYYVPKITLQPIVENAIVHGLETVCRNGKLDIYIFSTENDLYIKIVDNGCGMNETQLTELNDRLQNLAVNAEPSVNGRGTGIALRNVNSRIKICFGEQYGLHYRSMEGSGTEAEIILPLINDYNREVCEQRMNQL